MADQNASGNLEATANFVNRPKKNFWLALIEAQCMHTKEAPDAVKISSAACNPFIFFPFQCNYKLGRLRVIFVSAPTKLGSKLFFLVTGCINHES